jgi:hypothetical protein
LTQIAIVRRHVAPSEKHLPFGGHDLGKRGLTGGSPVGVARQEEHAGAVFTGQRQLNS